MPFPTENFNLSSFRNTIKDTAKPYLFLIQIPAVSTPSGEEITCFARSANLPAYNIQTTDIAFQGMMYKVATTPTFDNWQVTFLADESHVLRHRFLGWQSQIFDAQRQVGGSPVLYKADNIRVSQLGRAGGIVTTYNFVGMFPANVGEIALDHGTVDPETFTVDFAYDYYSIGEGDFAAAADISVNAFIKLDGGFNVAASVGGANLGLGVSTDGDVNVSLGGSLSFDF